MKLQELETKFQVSKTKQNWLKLIKLECLVLLIAHVACCIFLRIGLSEIDRNESSWLTNFGYENNSTKTNYVISFYYVIITMTTIGYGDISPYTIVEKVFMIIVALIATNICAYSYTQINEIVKYEELKKQNYNQMMQGINNEMNKIGLNILLQHKVRKYFEFQQYQAQQRQLSSESLFDILPDSLKEEVLQELTSGLSEEITILKALSQECKKQVRKCIKQKVLFPDEIIIKDNQLNDCLYYVAQGSVTISIPVTTISQENQQKIPNMNIRTLTKRSVFGYESFLLNQVSPYTIKSDGIGFLLFLQKDEFMSVLERFPHDFEKYMMIRDDAILNKKTQHLLYGCLSCNESNHQLNTCPFVNLIRKRQRPSEKLINRLNFHRKNQKKMNTLVELNENQCLIKEFVLKQQKEDEIKDLYNILASQKQSTNRVSSSEDTNSDSEESFDQKEETSSIIVYDKQQQSSLQSSILHPEPKNLSSRRGSKQIKDIKEQIDQIENKINKEQAEGIINNNSTKARQLYVIEEGEEDTQQYTQVNRSTELHLKDYSRQEVTDKIIEEKPVTKNSKFIYDSLTNASGNPYLGENGSAQVIDYQDLNLISRIPNSAEQIWYENQTPGSEKYKTHTYIEENTNQLPKTSLNITASLIQHKQNNMPHNKHRNSYKSIQKAESSRKRNSQTSITDLNKFEDKPLDEQCNIDDEANIMTSERVPNKELSFNDEMYNIYQKNAKKRMRSERKISQKLYIELESPRKLGHFSSQMFEDLISPLVSPYRKPKKVATIILPKQDSNDNSHSSQVMIQSVQSGSIANIGSGSLVQSAQNIQIMNQLNNNQLSPTILHKRGSQKQISILNKSTINNYVDKTPRQGILSSIFPQQIDSQAETQTSTKIKESQKRNSLQNANKYTQSFSNQVQYINSKNDPYKNQSLSPSPKNSDVKYNFMNQSSNETKIHTTQNLNGNSQNRLQTQFMISSGESHQFSSEYQIKFKEGLQDLDMLIVRKNMRILQEKGLSKSNLIKVLDNEIDIDTMKNYHFYFPDKNPKVIIYKWRKQYDAMQAKRNKAQSKISQQQKQTRKSKQSEQSNLSLKNLSTKPNSVTINQLSRPSLRV